MTPLQFKYWLQGFFELNSQYELEALTPVQIDRILNHLDMAKTTEPATADAFCGWLDGLLDAQRYPNPPAFTLEQTRRIEKRLNDSFTHVVPPATSSYPAAFDNSHLWKPAGPGGAVRC